MYIQINFVHQKKYLENVGVASAIFSSVLRFYLVHGVNLVLYFYFTLCGEGYFLTEVIEKGLGCTNNKHYGHISTSF